MTDHTLVLRNGLDGAVGTFGTTRNGSHVDELVVLRIYFRSALLIVRSTGLTEHIDQDWPSEEHVL